MFAEKCLFGMTLKYGCNPVKFSFQQYLNYLSSLHSLSASVQGSWLFLNRFLCSIVHALHINRHNALAVRRLAADRAYVFTVIYLHFALIAVDGCKALE